MISPTSSFETRARRWPVALKLLLLCLISTGLFVSDSLWVHVTAISATAALYLAAGPAFLRATGTALRLLLPIMAVIVVWHWVADDLREGTVILLRMLTLVGLANAVTLTSRLDEMTELAARCARPFERLGLPVPGVALALPLAMRFVPVLAARSRRMDEAWRARSRSRRKWRLFLPLLLTAMDDADTVSEALRARGGVQHLQRE